ncbi:MAG: hypothetical protein JNN11_05060 [Candidatus Doudnabacteria bacterium]|nr:hypothetical protein [Candidatus Doudnabacteria bacterium]
MKKILAIVALLLVTTSVQAAELMAPQSEKEANLNISASEVHKNLYVAAPNLSVNGKTEGDLTAAGGTVTLEGQVEDDLILAGGNLFVNGPIGGNARIAGGNINVSSRVAGDLVVAGGNVILSERAIVEGDLVVVGGSVVINAPIKGSVRFVGGELTLNSKVDRDVNIRATSRVVVDSKAEVVGKLSYKSPVEVVVKDGASLNEVVYTPMAKKDNRAKLAGFFTATLVIKLLAWMLAAWLLLVLRRTKLENVLATVKSQPWESLGFGFLALIGWPIAVLVVALTIVGYYVALVLGLAYVAALLIASLMSAIFVGNLAMGYLAKGEKHVPSWQIAVLGVLLWQLLSLIPIVGWVVKAAVFVMVLGALFKYIKSELKEKSI